MRNLFLNDHERDLLYALPAVTETKIVCGDCSAPPLYWTRARAIDDRRCDPWPARPVKTLLTLDGRCHKCGGRNYELASILAARAALDRMGRLEAPQLEELEQLYERETTL